MALQGVVAAGATAYLAVFAVRLGASPFLVGLLNGFPSLLLLLTAVPRRPVRDQADQSGE